MIFGKTPAKPAGRLICILNTLSVLIPNFTLSLVTTLPKNNILISRINFADDMYRFSGIIISLGVKISSINSKIVKRLLNLFIFIM